ncbi:MULTISPECIES: biotin--[acetyl-CoA-carboxylase] ligase [Burkholderia]|uniref:biotin--[biotin carboxyl-carrier protein] ligase n=2 Tax=Burkholderia humptydooensis TaxID=430531 RepID=A0A7U4P6K0_9BURK|nr:MULTISPECIES: biotin--[acetyl-CoA-carboxylase] ligase [Burkholderia]AJY41877.1 biotin--[acetyl-CoA-carboxylase] ligase [Burkholderia sp. 2002721687]ALX43889.1 biotin--protein ligase [Burkholderia humptydooensis]EIP89759.1 biotin--protein ligase [Burkholderia humptydooensis MSMB43]KVN08840.1 biotin--protein ligase [Burkholderia sp. MSMB1552]KWZ54682.1 biotin--protein ligase [Burkholderia sp. MSMB1588]
MNVATQPSTPASDGPLIDRARVDAHLAPAAREWSIEIVDTTGSTNADLGAHLKTLPRRRDALAAPIARVAYEQTAGRGRQGRPWFAKPGDALLCSVACVLPRPVGALAGLSLAVGAALAEAFAALPAEPRDGVADDARRIALKWPNDLLVATTRDGETAIVGKLAGVLIETVWNTSDATAVVIGFGVNVRTADAAAAEIDALRARDATLAGGLPPVALASVRAGATLTDTFAAALNALAAALPAFAADGLAPFAARWNALHAYAGREVALLERGVEHARGIAVGIDETGQLLLDTPAGRQAIAAGDVSLRAPGAVR